MYDDGRQTDTGGHLYLRPRDMAKIGQLVLQRGVWNGRQIVSAGWIDRSTATPGMLRSSPYGYLWWGASARHGAGEVRYVSARGNGGQTIMIVPQLDLVVVATAGNFDSDRGDVPLRLLENRIIPAVDVPAAAP
jgi:CubicO group peptidase (beta-lactamase class C family)